MFFTLLKTEIIILVVSLSSADAFEILLFGKELEAYFRQCMTCHSKHRNDNVSVFIDQPIFSTDRKL